MKKAGLVLRILLVCVGLVFLTSALRPDWGFYAHRKINYYAVMTVPPPLNQFYKSYAEYLREHAIDPDRRRYAVEGEGAKHFIDLDRWYRGDTLALTRDYVVDRILFGQWEWKMEGKSIPFSQISLAGGRFYFLGPVNIDVDSFALVREVNRIPSGKSDSISGFLYPLASGGHLMMTDILSVHGNLPYQFVRYYERLVRAMKEGENASVLKLSNDIGHYIADAHVPLHTTENYNGQLTDQLGIHAFWESRIPELYETDYFSAWVGRAAYIEDPKEFIWSVVLASHSLVPEVLSKELEARQNVKERNHYCYEERGSTMVRTQCPELAREYMRLMDGMVERQYEKCIKAVGSVWYSAWVDAGEPRFWEGRDPLGMEELEKDSTLQELPEGKLSEQDILHGDN